MPGKLSLHRRFHGVHGRHRHLHKVFLNAFLPFRLYGHRYAGPISVFTDPDEIYAQAMAADMAKNGHAPFNYDHFVKVMRPEDPMLDPDKIATLANKMRELWHHHVAYTRGVIVSLAGKLPDLDAAAARLMQNQDQIGDAVKPYYGDEVGAALSRLLREHVTLAADLLQNMKGSDAQKTEKSRTALYRNADDIAAFLASKNEHYRAADLRRMFKDHVDLMIEEAGARYAGRYADDIGAYDKAVEQAHEMADVITDGIVEKYPDKFKL